METPGQSAAALLPPIEENAEGEFYSEDQITEQDAEGEPDAATTAGVAESPDAGEDAPADDAPVADAPEPDAEAIALQQDAAAFRNLSKAAMDNPVGYMQYFMQNHMTQAQREQVGFTAPPPPKDPTAEWGTELAPSEMYLKEAAPAIETLRTHATYLEQLPGWATQVEQRSQGLLQAAMSHESEIAALKTTVAALAQAAGMKLPKAENLSDPKIRATFEAAVQAEARKVSAARTAKEAPVSRSVRQGAGDGGAEPIEVGDKSFLQIFHAVKRASARK